MVYATIQGVGDSDGLWRFSSAVAWTLTAGQGSWRPWLASMPDILSQRVPYVDGGVVRDSGSLTLELVDVGEALTETLRFDRGAAAYLAADVTSSATTMTLDAGAASVGIAVGDVVYLGSEAVEVSAISTSTLTVSRGELDTTGRAHVTGAPVYRSPPFLRRREVRLYLAPIDGAESDARLVGLYEVDDLAWSEDLTRWVLRASIAQGYLDRVVPRAPLDPGLQMRITPAGLTGYLRGVRAWQQDSSARVMAVDGEEVLEVETGSRVLRAQYGTTEDDIDGVTEFRVVLVGAVDFRFQEAGSTSTDRTDNNWVASDHWVDILLCLLLSPALESGGADNYNGSGSGLEGRNYSGLPAGYGLGVPRTLIDWGSFESSRAALDLRLPFFVLGPTAEPFREVVDPVLQAAGAFLAQEGGLIRLVVPELPTEADTASVAIDQNVMLARPDGLPRMSVRRPVDDLLTTIRYTLGPQGRDRTITWAEDFARLFNPDDLLELDGKTLELDVPGADPSAEGPWLRLGLRRLWLAYRPSLEVELELDVGEAWDWALAENASVDLPAVVDLAAGVRGLTGTAQLVEREPRLDTVRGVSLLVRARVQPSIRLGNISPAADVTSVAGAVATCAPNRYTSANAPSPLPTSDAGSFVVNDVVQLMGADGVPLASAATETVDGVSGNNLTLSGDFGGALAAGTTIYTADADEQVARQSSRYAAMSTSPLWFYA